MDKNLQASERHQAGRRRSAERSRKQQVEAKANALYQMCRRKLPQSQVARGEDEDSRVLRFEVKLNHIYSEEVLAAAIAKFERQSWQAHPVFDEAQPHVLKHMDLVAPPDWSLRLLRS